MADPEMAAGQAQQQQQQGGQAGHRLQQQQNQQQQNAAVIPRQHGTAFLQQRRWGRRWARPALWPAPGTGTTIALLTVIGLAVIGNLHAADSLSLTAQAGADSARKGHLDALSQSQNVMEEQREAAKLAHQQLFLWQKQQQQKQQRSRSQQQQQSQEQQRQQQKGEEEILSTPKLLIEGQHHHNNGSSSSGRTTTNILPYSMYQNWLLAQALAEHQTSAEAGHGGGEHEAADRPVLIHLPAYRRTSSSSSSADAAAGHSAGNAVEKGETLFTTGAKRRPTTTGISFTSAQVDHQQRTNQQQRHNPIRPQSQAANGSGGSRHRKRLPPIENDGSPTFRRYSTSAAGGSSNSRELMSSSLPNGHRQLLPVHLRRSSAENSLITRPSAMFLPAPTRQRLVASQQLLKPIQPVNGAGGIGQQMFLRRIGSSEQQLSEQELQQQQLLLEANRRFSPHGTAATANSALTALGQQMFGIGGGGSGGGGQAVAVPAQAPLAGSPFDMFTAGQAQPSAAAAQQLLSQLPNPLQILGQGSTMEQITGLARNLIQMTSGANGGAAGGGVNPQEVFSGLLSKAFSGSHQADGPASKLTSTAVQKAIASVANTGGNRAAGEKTAVLEEGSDAANGTATTAAEKAEQQQIQSLFSSSSNGNGAASKKASEETNGTANNDGLMLNKRTREEVLNGSLETLNTLPSEQRALLEAALRNGELEPEQAAKFIESEKRSSVTSATENGPTSAEASSASGLSTQGQNQQQQRRLVNAESRLMEWIQQNRPRPGQKSQGQEANKNGQNGNGNSTNDGTTNASSSANAKDQWAWATGPNAAGAGAEKLPYHGRYCGSFVETANSTRPHNIAGALWAVDERRLLLTKFRFQPLHYSENISLWAGPANLTGTSADFFPGDNGFHVMPVALHAQTFSMKPLQRIIARIRRPIQPMNAPQEVMVSKDTANGNNQTKATNPAEQEEEEEDEEDDKYTGGNALGRRARRNLYNELYGQQQQQHLDTTTGPGSSTTSTTTTTTTTAAPWSRTSFLDRAAGTSPTIVPVHFGGTARSFHLSLGTSTPPQDAAPSGVQTLTAHQNGEEGLLASAGQSSSNEELLRNSASPPSQNPGQSLGWHGGQQPLLLTLPAGRLVKTSSWLAVWDHRQKQALAMVLMPAGVSFQVPSTVQLRPLPSPAVGVAGIKTLRSGPIRVLDTKTIELTEFSLRTDEALPVWFMVGKEIMPNSKGQIVPIFDRKTNSFDCDSLREFHNETVTLRLPDPLDIKDVFWFAVFSLPRGIPLAHIYIPYNDMLLPPDLLGITTPQCTWNPAG